MLIELGSVVPDPKYLTFIGHGGARSPQADAVGERRQQTGGQ
jgi:hypothetical protein